MSPQSTERIAAMTARLRFHHLRQVPVSGLNQTFRLYRTFSGGIGVVIFRHEFSVSLW